MQLKFLNIPADGQISEEEQLNRFLRGHRVLTVQREFVTQGDRSFWASSVEYLKTPSSASSNATRRRVDYKEILSDDDFAVFARLRELRKEIAETEAVPPIATGIRPRTGTTTWASASPSAQPVRLECCPLTRPGSRPIANELITTGKK